MFVLSAICFVLYADKGREDNFKKDNRVISKENFKVNITVKL